MITGIGGDDADAAMFAESDALGEEQVARGRGCIDEMIRHLKNAALTRAAER